MKTLLFAALLLVFAACPDPAKGKAKATVAAPTAKADTAPLAGAVAYGFSQDGSTFLFTGAKVTGKHEGGFKTFSGTIDVVENDPTKSRVQATVVTSSVFSDSEKLTGHLQSPDFFAVEQFPEAKFVSIGVTTGEAGFEVRGDLTLHGVTKTISFPATIAITDAEVTVAADFAINRKDFGIVYPGKSDDLIADNVALKLDLHAKKK